MRVDKYTTVGTAYKFLYSHTHNALTNLVICLTPRPPGSIRQGDQLLLRQNKKTPEPATYTAGQLSSTLRSAAVIQLSTKQLLKLEPKPKQTPLTQTKIQLQANASRQGGQERDPEAIQRVKIV